MRKIIYHPAKHLWLLIIFAIVHTISVNAQGFSPETQSRLQKAIEKFQNDPSHPFVGGISAAVKVDDLAFWQGVAGFAARNVDAENNLLPGGTAFTTSTLSRIYSITKTFTAALVLELANDSALSLDDPIIKYMPLMNLYNPDLNSAVTIRQLLSHESGYSDWEENLQLQIAIAFQPTKVWTPYELMAFTNQLDPPGTIRRYSHNNYVFLGAIVEAATGKPLEELFRERFFTPLGLTSMYLDGRETIGSRGVLASPHDNISPFNPIFFITGQPVFPDAYTNISAFPFTAITSLAFAGGGIVSNAADLAEWGNALFGGRATRKATLDTMLNSISSTPDEFGNRLGYGIKNTPFISGSFDFIGHNGSAPGYRSVMFYNVERKMTIVVLTNFAGVSPYDIAKAIFEALPEFICGNENKAEAKIHLCFNGNNLCIDRSAAPSFIRKGAYLGNCEPSSIISSTIETEKSLPARAFAFTLFPNPSSEKVSVVFETTEAGTAHLDLFDVGGKLVSNVFNRQLEKGVQQKIQIGTTGLPSGVYIVRLQTASGIDQEKLIVRH
jgi:CubicO group peptidase (beta-lactamase class C family)